MNLQFRASGHLKALLSLEKPSLSLGCSPHPTLPATRRWHLAVQGKKETHAYIANGAALCASFFLIRVVAYGAGLAHLWTLRRYWAAPGVPFLRR